jgi:hypothetical protein
MNSQARILARRRGCPRVARPRWRRAGSYPFEQRSVTVEVMCIRGKIYHLQVIFNCTEPNSLILPTSFLRDPPACCVPRAPSSLTLRFSASSSCRLPPSGGFPQSGRWKGCVLQLDERFGGSAVNLHIAVLDKEHIGRRVGSAQHR